MGMMNEGGESDVGGTSSDGMPLESGQSKTGADGASSLDAQAVIDASQAIDAPTITDGASAGDAAGDALAACLQFCDFLAPLGCPNQSQCKSLCPRSLQGRSSTCLTATTKAYDCELQRPLTDFNCNPSSGTGGPKPGVCSVELQQAVMLCSSLNPP
jgi:hypothetical protein